MPRRCAGQQDLGGRDAQGRVLCERRRAAHRSHRLNHRGVSGEKLRREGGNYTVLA